MRSKRRVIAALAVAALCAPGTLLRSEVSKSHPVDISLHQVAGPSEDAVGAWQHVGTWEYRADNLMFGGFSAVLAVHDDRLHAFSDRGHRLNLVEPDKPQPGNPENRVHHPAHHITMQHAPPLGEFWLRDIESATRDPETGTYWLGYENTHAVVRFTRRSDAEGTRSLGDEVDWYANAGAEAMVRLSDGRFVIVPEGDKTGLIFADDPVRGGKPATFAFASPLPDFAPVDMVQLPDGRLLVLLRKVAWRWPPFESAIAVADPPVAGQENAMRPQIVLDLNTIVAAENYEGLTIREREDGRLDVWIISDDNRSAFQRTLLVKLLLDLASLTAPTAEAPETGVDEAKQKARE